jgi:hypothetical protein
MALAGGASAATFLTALVQGRSPAAALAALAGASALGQLGSAATPEVRLIRAAWRLRAAVMHARPPTSLRRAATATRARAMTLASRCAATPSP